MRIRIWMYFLKKYHKVKSLERIERVLTTIDIFSICMSTFESHTTRIERKGSLKGIEFTNTHLDLSSLSRLNFVKSALFYFTRVLPIHMCIKIMCTTRMANFLAAHVQFYLMYHMGEQIK